MTVAGLLLILLGVFLPPLLVVDGRYGVWGEYKQNLGMWIIFLICIGSLYGIARIVVESGILDERIF